MTPHVVFERHVSNPQCAMYPYLEFLLRKATGEILEIGVEEGVSTACFLKGLEGTSGHLYSVDINKKCGELYKDHPNWSFIFSDSQNVVVVKEALLATSLDVLMIDGWHEAPIVGKDLENYAPLVKKGGVILMHDIRMLDVMEAYHQFLVKTGYPHFELGGHSEAPNSGGMAWGLGVVYVQ